PYAWLGMPLITSQDTLGAVVLQRDTEPSFSRWQRELLVTVAAQISAAIQNARRFGEAERLYTLTDAALAERVQQLQALLDAMQDGVLMVDRSGRILLINPVAADMLAQTPLTLINTPLTRPETFGFSQEEWQARIAQLQDQSHIPTSLTSRCTLQRQEKLCHFARQETAVLAKDGALIGWLILLRDITQETKLAERRTDLTRMIVHDLRNPLTTISSTIQLALRQLAASPDDAASLLHHARATTADMLDMVDSLMDITRMETGNMIVDAEAMHIRPLAEQVLTRLRPYAQQQQITLQLQAPPQLPPVWADAELVRRILINLLDNALKFTPKNGQITVT
ncbi:MAG: PAS domain-containing protein, partial [Candidatus Thermofonsia bacterium]